MGVSTDGYIFYGILFDEGQEYPWDEEEDGDIQTWWLKECGFKPTKEFFDKNGNYINGKEPSREEMSSYFKEKRDFLDSKPCPVEELNYCSDGCPMYALVLPNKTISGLRGDPTVFNPLDLKVTEEEKKGLIDFCEKYGLECGEPKWYVGSFWG